MIRNWLCRMAGILALLAAPASAISQALSLTGLGPEPKVLSLAALEAIGVSEVTEGREVTVDGQTRRLEFRLSGVSLKRVLEAQGIETLDRYKVRAATILIIATDGYKASFSWGEVFNSPAGASIIVVTRENGEKLPAREGDFAIRAMGDTRPGPRHVRLVSEIRVILN